MAAVSQLHFFGNRFFRSVSQLGIKSLLSPEFLTKDFSTSWDLVQLVLTYIREYVLLPTL